MVSCEMRMNQVSTLQKSVAEAEAEAGGRLAGVETKEEQPVEDEAWDEICEEGVPD